MLATLYSAIATRELEAIRCQTQKFREFRKETVSTLVRKAS